MKDAVLLELAARWERDATPPEVFVADEAPVDRANKAKAEGERETLRACADTLRSLVSMLGEGRPR